MLDYIETSLDYNYIKNVVENGVAESAFISIYNTMDDSQKIT